MKISPSSTKPRSKWKVHCGGLLFSSPLRERLTIFITKTGTFFSIMTFILKKGGKKSSNEKVSFLIFHLGQVHKSCKVSIRKIYAQSSDQPSKT